jgi:hypothetical protein
VTQVIIFVFAGRRPNLELQLPMVRRILDENPNTRFDIWNFARNESDREFIKTITGERIMVWNGTSEGFASPVPTLGEGKQFGAGEHNAAYEHYSQPQFKDTVFVKVDDDIVFLETARFATFIKAIRAYPHAALVANIINNGACTPVTPGIWDGFRKLGMSLLDIHRYGSFAEMAHSYFFTHYGDMLSDEVELIPTTDWLSINAVGYTWPVLQRVITTIGTPHPAYLAGRNMVGWGRVFGDEGVFQLLPRIIVKGFTCAHLTYGPQESGDSLDRWRENYRLIGQSYLDSFPPPDHVDLPGLSAVSSGQTAHIDREALIAQWGPNNWRVRALENDPCVGRFTP